MNNLPIVTKNLLIINVLCFFGAYVAGTRYGISIDDMLGLHFFMDPDFRPFQFVTYMFMHKDYLHLFFNMFAVWMFGRTLEQVLGSKRFLTYYMVCGIGAGLIQEAVQGVECFMLSSAMPEEAVKMVLQDGSGLLKEFKNYIEPSMASLNKAINTPCIGASGSVFGLLLAFGMLFPNSQMFVFPIPFPIKAKFFVIGYAVIELFAGLGASGDGIAHFAHLGGMIFGFFLIMYWRKKNNNGHLYF